MNLPNKITLFRIALSPVLMGLILLDTQTSRAIAMLVFAVACISDLWDGYLARKYNIVTNFGRFMDPLADKILVSSAFISFVALDYVRAWMVIIILFREYFITGLRSLAAYKGIVILPSFLAQWKTVSQMLSIGVILTFRYLQSALPPDGLEWMHDPAVFSSVADVCLGISMILTLTTGADYLVKNGSILKSLLR